MTKRPTREDVKRDFAVSPVAPEVKHFNSNLPEEPSLVHAANKVFSSIYPDKKDAVINHWKFQLGHPQRGKNLPLFDANHHIKPLSQVPEEHPQRRTARLITIAMFLYNKAAHRHNTSIARQEHWEKIVSDKDREWTSEDQKEYDSHKALHSKSLTELKDVLDNHIKHSSKKHFSKFINTDHTPTSGPAESHHPVMEESTSLENQEPAAKKRLPLHGKIELALAGKRDIKKLHSQIFWMPNKVPSLEDYGVHKEDADNIRDLIKQKHTYKEIAIKVPERSKEGFSKFNKHIYLHNTIYQISAKLLERITNTGPMSKDNTQKREIRSESNIYKNELIDLKNKHFDLYEHVIKHLHPDRSRNHVVETHGRHYVSPLMEEKSVPSSRPEDGVQKLPRGSGSVLPGRGVPAQIQETVFGRPIATAEDVRVRNAHQLIADLLIGKADGRHPGWRHFNAHMANLGIHKGQADEIHRHILIKGKSHEEVMASARHLLSTHFSGDIVRHFDGTPMGPEHQPPHVAALQQVAEAGSPRQAIVSRTVVGEVRQREGAVPSAEQARTQKFFGGKVSEHPEIVWHGPNRQGTINGRAMLLEHSENTELATRHPKRHQVTFRGIYKTGDIGLAVTGVGPTPSTAFTNGLRQIAKRKNWELDTTAVKVSRAKR